MQYLLLLVIGGTAWLFLNGFGELRMALENSEPRQMTIAQFESAPESSGWFRITDCKLDMLETISSESMGTVDELYIPVIRNDHEAGDRVHLLLKTDDPQLIADLERAGEALRTIESESAAARFAADNPELVFRAGPVEGMTEYGTDGMDDDLRAQVLALDETVSPEFVVLTNGDRPSLGSGVAKLGGGLGIFSLAVFAFVSARRSKKREADASTAAAADDATADAPRE